MTGPDLHALSRRTGEVYERNAERFDRERDKGLFERPWLDRRLDLIERFDAILGWDSFFHLTAQEQRGTLPRIAGHLRPFGRVLLTVGPMAGEVVGHVGDDPVYHASLSPQEYTRRLEALGLDILDFVKEEPAAWGRTVLLARKR